ncbi:MAG TPA: trypsin-like peptidase domain-containing protein [Verrucomicrobiales bacterium]|nr:trypsin-like peptidase domain-containing protein [Verrucomicrobiales bacterium]
MKLLPAPLRRAGLAALFLSAAVYTGISQDKSGTDARPPATSDKGGVFQSSLSFDKKPLERGGAVLKSYADMLEKVQPSVVTILTGIETPKRQRISRNEQLYRLYFGLPPVPDPKPGEDRWQQLGIGSGVIVSANGYILTNRHVIFPPDLDMDAQQYIDMLRLRVSIPGREGHLPAKLVDFSQDMDVAVIKLSGTEFPHATLADSDTVRVGDISFALGAPFGIDKTVTMGIISAKRNDEVVAGFEKQELLQTDASINPGNSGGPLIDADGRVIGINTAIYSRSGGNQGIGFAIPINKAVSAADALSRPRGYLGAKLQNVNQSEARMYNFTGGALISEVEQGTPAAASGLKEGDVVLSVDNKKVENADDLRKRLAANPPGTKMKVSIFRASIEKRTDINLTLGERPNFFLKDLTGPDAESPAPATVKTDTPAAESNDDHIVGMTLAPVTATDHEKLKLPEDATGLIITRILPNTPAANCGLEKGDIILRINRTAPRNHSEAVDAILNHSREGKVSLQVRKGDSTRNAVMELK